VVGLDFVDSPGTTVVGSVTDRAVVRACLAGVNGVLHTATLHKPHIVSHDRSSFVDTNIAGTLVLAEEAANAGVGGNVFTNASSRG
jgi:nucleoside-diphosphate-sugar epimerase